jgi:3',5'-cyclic AMP phosphodiesterase CpdA
MIAFMISGSSVAIVDSSGYSGGRQLSFPERELRAARSSRDIDWVVVAMHQVMISSSDANGADLGLRQKYGPLFDKYGVDLVVCGHEHNYERSLAVRGVVTGSESSRTRRHRPRTPSTPRWALCTWCSAAEACRAPRTNRSSRTAPQR